MFVAARRATLPPSLFRSCGLVRLIFAAVRQTFSFSLNPLTAVPLVLSDSRAPHTPGFNIYEQGGNSNVIHVVVSFLLSPFLILGLQYCIHKLLEGSRGVTHPKEHYFGFKESSAYFGCAFPLIGFMDSDVVVPPTHIKFTKYLYSLQVFDALYKVWEWSDIFASDGIEGSIVNNILHFIRVFLWYHEH